MSPDVTTAPLTLPARADDWSDFLTARCDEQLVQARRIADATKSDRPTDAAEALARWNDLTIALSNAFAASSLFSHVHPDEAIRTQAETAEQEANKLSTDLSLDRELHDVFAALDPSGLDAAAARVLEHTLRDFRRAGVDRDDATRQRLRELAEREKAVGQEFDKNTRDDVRQVRLDPEQLTGLPDDYVEAHPVGDDGKVVITTDYPDVFPFLTFARDADARRRLYVEFNNRAWPANDALLQELLSLRAEHASLLGYGAWPDYDAEIKMIGNGRAIGEFIDQIADAAEQPGRRDIDVLLRRLQQDDPTATAVDGASARYYAEAVRRENFDVDAQQVRTYFDFAKVRAGLLEVTGRLFGLEYAEVATAPTWHEDVTAYDVRSDGRDLGRIYLDLHPREGKFKHAAQFTLTDGVAGHQLPEGVLVCNFPRGLMEHDDVVTLFHEFGHLVHHVVAGHQEWAPFAGVSTEWDFVEAPSQLLEEWAWDADILRTFATNEAGEPIPAELVAKMRAGDDFGKGYFARTQMFYAALSYQLHRARPDDIGARVEELRAAYDLIAPVPDTHMHAAFGHLVGYTSAYYTYMWSLVIAKDLFSAFDPADLFAPNTARRYRDTILAPGGSKDAADLVRDFLGRPYNFEAFARWLEQAPAV